MKIRMNGTNIRTHDTVDPSPELDLNRRRPTINRITPRINRATVIAEKTLFIFL